MISTKNTELVNKQESEFRTSLMSMVITLTRLPEVLN